MRSSICPRARQDAQGKFEVIEELKGRDMEGWQYYGPFDDSADAAREASRDPVEEVGEEDGTGSAHRAGLRRGRLSVGRPARHRAADEDGTYPRASTGSRDGRHGRYRPIVADLKVKAASTGWTITRTAIRCAGAAARR
jgi:hypothetical protein